MTSVKRPTVIVVVSSSVVLAAWRFLIWRARTRACKTVERIQALVQQDSPLIDYADPLVRGRMFRYALKRASNWISLGADPQPMVGQVGGVSIHKQPLLTLKPDYVLKPLLTDHRGIREIAFYEAMRAVAKQAAIHPYTAFLTGEDSSKHAATTTTTRLSSVQSFGEAFDTVALALAMLARDAVVTQSELALKDAYKAVRREVEALHRVAKFTPPYYGVLLGHQLGRNTSKASSLETLTPSQAAALHAPCGVPADSHLLLQDLTVNFSKPCVMDLKLGSQTYEPDATPEKRARESSKYPQQEEFCFRIIGMRMYDPTHKDADDKGFRSFGKEYGRSLSTRQELLEAFRTFFRAGIEQEAVSPNGGAPTEEEATTSLSSETKAKTNSNNNNNNNTVAGRERIRTRSISNLVVQLRPLRRWFEENTTFRFYASSLLIVYEGDVAHDGRDVTDVKMIDFGRVRRQAGSDEGYKNGLSSLKHVLTDLLDEEQEQRERINSEGGALNSSNHSQWTPRPATDRMSTA